MTDIDFGRDKAGARAGATSSQDGDRPVRHEAELFELIELFFFAYRDFIADPDAILGAYGFGRAHHRVLHFVNRNPGLRVADLLDILKITKQSLGRVLKQLVDEGYIVQRPGPSDRRQRLLHPTSRGRDLALRLATPQFRRMSAALDVMTPQESEAVHRFLMNIINEAERPQVAALLYGRRDRHRPAGGDRTR